MLPAMEPLIHIPDWRLTTAEILYHMPDHPHVLGRACPVSGPRAEAFRRSIASGFLAPRDRRAVAFRARRV